MHSNDREIPVGAIPPVSDKALRRACASVVKEERGLVRWILSALPVKKGMQACDDYIAAKRGNLSEQSLYVIHRTLAETAGVPMRAPERAEQWTLDLCSRN